LLDYARQLNDAVFSECLLMVVSHGIAQEISLSIFPDWDADRQCSDVKTESARDYVRLACGLVDCMACD